MAPRTPSSEDITWLLNGDGQRQDQADTAEASETGLAGLGPILVPDPLGLVERATDGRFEDLIRALIRAVTGKRR